MEIMKLYKMQRRSDGLFFGASPKVHGRHDHAGKFYLSENSAIVAIESSGRILTDYDLIVYEATQKDIINYQELALA